VGKKESKCGEMWRKSAERRDQSVFTGEHYHIIDSKGRLAMPAKLREELGESFMIAPAIRGNCIKVYSMAEWELFLEPILKTPRKTSEATLRYLHRTAAQVTPDTQGRILLSPGLIDKAQIKKDAVVIGCGSYIEIWSKENYETAVAEEDLDAIIKELEELGL
jgi:MraZ protein